MEQTPRPRTPKTSLNLTNERHTEMTTLALSCMELATCHSPCIHIHSLTESPDHSLSSSITSFKTARSSITSPSQSRRQSGNEQDSSYEMPPGSLVATLTSSAAPPSDKKDLSGILQAKLEHCSPDFSNLTSTFSTIQQSDENIDLLTGRKLP